MNVRIAASPTRLLNNCSGSLAAIYFLYSAIFPLQESHPHAMMAALAAEAAARQDKFWEMHDIIYEHQDELSGNRLLSFAEALNLDLQQFAHDWKSQATLAKVESDFEGGLRSGVNGTPSFFLNGNRLNSYDESYESLAEAVRAVTV